MTKTLVILAAGIGSRFGGLKQLQPVGPSGEFIADYSVFDAMRAGFQKIVFVIRRDMEQVFQEQLGDRIVAHVPVEYVYQEILDLPDGVFAQLGRKKPWGTGHALLVCREVVDSPFAVINADDYYGRSAYTMLGEHLDQTASDPQAFGMVGYTLKDTLSASGTVARGICRVDGNGMLESVIERTKLAPSDGQVKYEVEHGRTAFLSGNEIVSMNFWGFKPSIFPQLEQDFRTFIGTFAKSTDAEFFLPTVVQGMVQQKKAAVRVLRTQESWCGMTCREDLELVRAQIRRRIDAGDYPSSLWA
jgi:NDP-sugar pyrophosphorylase family protein